MDIAHQHEVKCTNFAQHVFGAKFCQIVKKIWDYDPFKVSFEIL
jgi:hypothetical protein